jgi:hypothetical protein
MPPSQGKTTAALLDIVGSLCYTTPVPQENSTIPGD